MKRGDVLLVAGPGDYGKPRPAVVIQSDRLERSGSVVVCPLTSDLTVDSAVRLPVTPDADNGLGEPSEVMIEKVQAVRRDRCGPVVGRLGPDALAELDRRLAFVIGLDGLACGDGAWATRSSG